MQSWQDRSQKNIIVQTWSLALGWPRRSCVVTGWSSLLDPGRFIWSVCRALRCAVLWSRPWYFTRQWWRGQPDQRTVFLRDEKDLTVYCLAYLWSRLWGTLLASLGTDMVCLTLARLRHSLVTGFLPRMPRLHWDGMTWRCNCISDKLSYWMKPSRYDDVCMTARFLIERCPHVHVCQLLVSNTYTTPVSRAVLLPEFHSLCEWTCRILSCVRNLNCSTKDGNAPIAATAKGRRHSVDGTACTIEPVTCHGAVEQEASRKEGKCSRAGNGHEVLKQGSSVNISVDQSKGDGSSSVNHETECKPFRWLYDSRPWTQIAFDRFQRHEPSKHGDHLLRRRTLHCPNYLKLDQVNFLILDTGQPEFFRSWNVKQMCRQAPVLSSC